MLIWFLVAILVLIAAASIYFACVAVFPRVYPPEETLRIDVENGKIFPQELASWEQKELFIRSPFGYKLHLIYFPQPGANKTIIITHGITWSLYGSVKYMPIFRKRGFNILLWDLRHHGRSGGPNSSFGYFEKHDLKVVADWAFLQLGSGGQVGTHGESLGAATVLQHAAVDSRMAFVIADCPFSDLRNLFAFRARADYHIPPFPLLYLASLVSWGMTGLRFDFVSPIRDLRSVKTPILFIHGKDDTYIPPRMSQDMAKAKTQGISRLYLAPNAGHAEAFWNNQVEYDQQVRDFLAEIKLI